MTLSVDTSSPPSQLNKELISSPTSMATKSSSPLLIISPHSDQSVWSDLHNRVQILLESRQSNLPSFDSNTSEGESNRGKRRKEDSMLLLRGFASIASSLSQFTCTLDNALQGARDLAKPAPLTTETLHSSSSNAEKPEGERAEEPVTAEVCPEEPKGVKRKLDECCPDDHEEDGDVSKKEKGQKQLAEKNLRRVKNLAVCMASKSASLAKELKSVKSDMCFLKERCALLEEENRRLRDGFRKEMRPEEDDLVSLQLEALLSEKSRLATENANLMRENQCLRQLVEYHKFTTQDLSASYEQVIEGLCLDFSSPTAENRSIDSDNDDADNPTTPGTPSDFEYLTPLRKNIADDDELLQE